MSEIGIITNPHSKLNKRNPKRPDALAYIAGQRGKFALTQSLDELQEVTQDFFRKGISIIAINGGDGTISQTLSAVYKAYGSQPFPKIAILRGGTINVLANNLRVRGQPEKLLSKLLENHSAKAGEHNTISIPSINIDGRIGFLFGTGIAPNFLEKYYLHKSGPIGAAYWALRTWASGMLNTSFFRKMMPDEVVHIHFDEGQSLRFWGTTCLASTVKNMPLGLTLFNDLKANPNLMQFMAFSEKAAKTVWRLPFLLTGNKNSLKSGRISSCTTGFEMSYLHPFSYTLDGELYRTENESLHVTKGPTIEFIV